MEGLALLPLLLVGLCCGLPLLAALLIGVGGRGGGRAGSDAGASLPRQDSCCPPEEGVAALARGKKGAKRG